MNNPEWMRRGACVGKPAAFWFEHELYAHGKQLCDRCEVRIRCLNFALDEGIWHGMWGGYSERQRVAIRRKRRRAA